MAFYAPGTDKRRMQDGARDAGMNVAFGGIRRSSGAGEFGTMGGSASDPRWRENGGSWGYRTPDASVGQPAQSFGHPQQQGSLNMSAYNQGPSAGFGGGGPVSSWQNYGGYQRPSTGFGGGGLVSIPQSAPVDRRPNMRTDGPWAATPAFRPGQAQPIQPPSPGQPYDSPQSLAPREGDPYPTTQLRDGGNQFRQWAMRNPNDPRATPILESMRRGEAAWRERMAQQGTPVGPDGLTDSQRQRQADLRARMEALRESAMRPMPPLPGGGNYFSGGTPGQSAFGMQTIGMDGLQTDLQSALAQRDAYIQGLNQEGARFAMARGMGQNIGPPVINHPAIMRQANDAVRAGYTNPFGQYFQGGTMDSLIARLRQAGYPVGP